MTFMSLLKQPSAYLPLLMSLTAFLLIIAVLSTVGITHQQDEGAPARIFQLLILLQMPAITYFSLKRQTQSPRPALIVLTLQVGAAILAVVIVVWLESSMAV